MHFSFYQELEIALYRCGTIYTLIHVGLGNSCCVTANFGILSGRSWELNNFSTIASCYLPATRRKYSFLFSCAWWWSIFSLTFPTFFCSKARILSSSLCTQSSVSEQSLSKVCLFKTPSSLAFVKMEKA